MGIETLSGLTIDFRKKENNMDYDIVEIFWRDSRSGSHSWEYLDEITPIKTHLIHSVGFLMDDGEVWKTIGCCVGGGQVLFRLSIPIACIEKVNILKKANSGNCKDTE